MSWWPTPEEAYEALREAIPRRPELRFTQWPDLHRYWTPERIAGLVESMPPYQGACYIATQVFCHLVPFAKPYSHGRSHFWAVIGFPTDTMLGDGRRVRINGGPGEPPEIWDPTFDQFLPCQRAEIYSLGQKTHFKTLSKRSEELLKEVLCVAGRLAA